MTRILLDADNVLFDFVGHVLDTAREMFAFHPPARRQLQRWDIFEDLGLYSDEVSQLKEAISQPGWCASIPIFDGAKAFVAAARRLGEVYVVTSPWNSPTWAFERLDSLRHHFKFGANRVVSTAAKELVAGDFLVDDRISHIREWARENPTGLAMLFTQPFNEHEKITEPNSGRVRGYDEVLALIKQRADEEVLTA